MILLKRKRLIFWLIKAYIKRWGKVITASFILGIAIFLLLYFYRNSLNTVIPIFNTQDIGYVADIPEDDFPNNLPSEILEKSSRGLTKISPTGQILPDLAKKWEIKDDGKTFIFYLRDGIYFTDGEPFTSSSVNYNFADVQVETPTKNVVIFKLKDKYSPFLVTVANKKIFKDNYIGISDYKIKSVNIENGFINNFMLKSNKNKENIKYFFYPSQTALKDAYMLGDVSKINNITDLSYKDNLSFSKFNNTKIVKGSDTGQITTVFLNTNDPILSDKKIRKALAYSLPDEFEEGIRNYTPYKKDFWANKSDEALVQDLEYAKSQLEDSSASDSGKLKIELKTLQPYLILAKKLSKNWREVGIETDIVVVDGIPSRFQAFLGDLPVLNDPDQYTFWHTGQPNNITNYKNLRIDKLLEDGRRTYNINERKAIYSDFQKYLIDDMPAIFLYLPTSFVLERK